jgi:site-specific DNA-methyltransferase (adenine-specific)
MGRNVVDFDGGHKGIFEDSRCMVELDNESVACIVTSPPYNIGVDYKGYDDDIPEEHYERMLLGVIGECYRVAKRGAVMFMNLGIPRSDPSKPWRVAQLIEEQALESDGWSLLQTIAWVKSISLDIGDSVFSKGHYRPKRGELLNDTWEPVFLFAKGPSEVKLNRDEVGVPYSDESNIERWKGGRNKRCRGNAWFVPYETTQASREHPAPFPVDLAGKCILLGSNEGDVVLDPFMGSGSTLLAAKSHGRIGVGYDVDASNKALVSDNMQKVYDSNAFGTLCDWRYDDEQVF